MNSHISLLSTCGLHTSSMYQYYWEGRVYEKRRLHLAWCSHRNEWINTLIYSTNIDWTPAAPLRDIWFPSKILEQPNTVNKEFLSIRIKLSWFLEKAVLPSTCCFWHRHTHKNIVHRITLGHVPWLFSGPACRAFCRCHPYWVWPTWYDGSGGALCRPVSARAMVWLGHPGHVVTVLSPDLSSCLWQRLHGCC